MAFIQVAKSSTLSLNETSRTLESAGRTVYRFGFGESPFPPPRRLREALREAAHRADYTDVAGLPELRQKIASFHHEADGYPISMDQVLVAPGTKPLLHNIMRAFQPADVFLPWPSWVSYAPQARFAGHDVIGVPTSYAERWRVTPDALEKVLSRQGAIRRQKLMVLNYPGNPDGLTYSFAELQALADVLRRFGVWVISDEIYAMLDHQDRHVSLASIYPERTLVTTGLSKWCGAGGWRLGALILPPDAPAGLANALIGLGSEVYSCAPAPMQVAALAVYELDMEIHTFLAAQRRILRAIGTVVRDALARIGVLVHQPQGGFYLLLDFAPFAVSLKRHGIDHDGRLCDRLLAETGVVLLPGKAFGMPPGSYTARLAYVDFDGETALRDEDHSRTGSAAYAAKMLEGISALGAWLGQLNSSR